MNKPEVELLSSLPDLLDSQKEFSFIDLGSGNGSKGRIVSDLFVKRVKSFFLVDIQPLELQEAIMAHKDVQYAVHPTVIDFKDLDKRFPVSGSTNIIMLFGGTYGNFFDTDANAMLLKTIGSADDRVIISMPIVPAEQEQDWIKAYSNKTVESFGLGVLENIGLDREDFISSPIDKAFKFPVRGKF